MFVLALVGTLAMLRAFGEPIVPMTIVEFLFHFIISLAVGCGCFYAFHKLTAKWSNEGKIPEYDKLNKIESEL